MIFISSVQEVMPYQPHIPTSVYSDGRVTWYFPTVLKSICQLKVDYFPWDQQRCELKFGTWAYDGSEVRKATDRIF